MYREERAANVVVGGGCLSVGLQTSWEHARRASITYLRALPAGDGSPFDRGCLANWWTFVTSGDANQWVRTGSRAPTAVVVDAPLPSDPTLLM